MKKYLLATAMFAATLAPVAARADSPQELVDSSTLALESLMDTPQGQQADQYLRQARAVVICPDIFRGGFVFGGEGGGCVLVARAAGGSWSSPAFYGMGGGSFGLQIGVQDAKVLMLVMTSEGLNALLNSQFKVGADAAVSVATFGGGVNGAMSTNIKADIITFSRSEGLYGGVSLGGTVFSNDSGKDQAYYGNATDARSIVVNMSASNPGANPLRAMLTRYGG